VGEGRSDGCRVHDEGGAGGGDEDIQEPEDDDDDIEEDDIEEAVEEEGLPSSSEDDEDHIVQLLVSGKRTRTQYSVLLTRDSLMTISLNSRLIK
jgi:hypothetical protein